MKRIVSIVLLVCLFATLMLYLTACSSSGPDWRTYDKVYKDSNGEWKSRQVTYDAQTTSSPIVMILAVGAVIFILYCVFHK